MKPHTKRYVLQGILFVLTIITTTLAGAEWIFGRQFFYVFIDEQALKKLQITLPDPLGWPEFMAGLEFSIPFLAILTVHEFGHYFTAKYHHVKATLPYYIPFWFGLSQTIGTMGAFIRLESEIKSRKKFFDIGIAGPLAGFVVALLVLWYGFANLPTLDYVFKIHPEYQKYGMGFAKVVGQRPMTGAIVLGDNLLFSFFKTYVADPTRLPPAFEMIHYPWLLAGYLALFFTSLNLIPIGQLDGGHILYGLVGKRASAVIMPILLVIFVFYAGLGFFTPQDFKNGTATSWWEDENFIEQISKMGFYAYFLYLCFSRVSKNVQTVWLLALGVIVAQLATSQVFPTLEGYSGFMPFVFLLGRFLGVYHPDTEQDDPLNWQRQALGWFALLVFVVCFCPKPFVVL